MSHESSSPIHRKNQGFIFTALVVMSVGGIAVMEYSDKYGFWYWLVMAVLFGAVSIGLAWKHDHDTPGDQSHRVKKQVLHWGTLLVGLLLAYLMPRGEAMAASNQGLVSLLLLSITAVLAGVHFNWRMAVVGLILAATFVGAVLAEEAFWPLMFIALLAVVVIWVYKSKPQSSD